MNIQSCRSAKRASLHAGLACALLVLGLAPSATAQPAGNEMCGDGTTLTVQLSGRSSGIDNLDGLFRNIIVPDPLPADSIALPNGCRFYVLLISGYRQNAAMDKITFYSVAEFAARNNGYVHVSWWNNLMKEYMGGPLHPANVTVERFFPLSDYFIPPTPGGWSIDNNLTFDPLFGLFFPDNFRSTPKANPGSDEQFQADAAAMIRAIKANNPNAIVVVAGHSMGGDSAARLGYGHSPALPIDLLALIDPANNQDLPVGSATQRNYNWTRWRAAHDFLGFKQWDCVRNAIGLCRDFDPRIFVFQANCITIGPYLSKPPLIPTLAPVQCPYLAHVHPGTQRGFGTNVKHLYHRWQTEAAPPRDFNQTELFNHPAPLSNSILDANYQKPFLQNFLLEGDPDKTCANEFSPDPRRNDVSKLCVRWDGHGEIVGYRGTLPAPVVPVDAALDPAGLQLQNWPTTAASRRIAMIGLANLGSGWQHRPPEPDTCMVCDDIISIMVHLMNQQPGPPPPADTTPPVSLASASPGPNPNGWNSEDVLITVNTADNAGGSGVKEIEHSISGASPAATVLTPGSTAQEAVTTEGTTTLAFFARDNAGNVEATKTLEVMLDKTPPEITAVTDVQPNPDGWVRRNVLVSFPASDALSGLAFRSPDVSVSIEGAAQDIVGTAEDNAGNQATAIVTLNLDKTEPVVSITTPPDEAVYLLNAAAKADFACTDSLSGIKVCRGPVANGAPVDTSSVGQKQFRVGSADFAYNDAGRTHNYSVRYASSGLLAPIQPMPAMNIAEIGSTVYFRYQLRDAKGAPVSDPASFLTLVALPVVCGSDTHRGEPVRIGGTGSPALRYDAQSNIFTFAWQTDESWAGCHILFLTLADRTRYAASFQVQ